MIDPTTWLPATPDGLLRGVTRVLETCTIELACKPYLATASNMFAAADGVEYERFVTPAQFVPWSDHFLDILSGVVPMLAMGASVAGGEGVEDRFFGAVAYILELFTRGETPDVDRTEAIVSGGLRLDAALREREVSRLARAVERAQDQLDGPPPPDLDPAAVAELARANVLRVDDLKIPIPNGARNQPEGLTAFPPDERGIAMADFTWSSAAASARAFYTTWARKARWLVELDAGEDTGMIHRLRLARDDRKIDLMIVARNPNETMLMFRLRARAPVTYELSER